jgi:hypothetical protein
VQLQPNHQPPCGATKIIIRCVKFRPYQKNTLLGFADFLLVKTGIIIRGCTWHRQNDKEWIGFPAQKYEDQDGKTQCAPMVEFAEGATEAREQFRKYAVAAVHAVAHNQKNEEVA